MLSIDSFHVPSADCCAASTSAGRCVNTRFATSRWSRPDCFTTSTRERYLIAPPAWSSIQPSGKRTGSGGGGGAAGVAGAGLGAPEGGGNVKVALAERQDALWKRRGNGGQRRVRIPNFTRFARGTAV